MDDRTLDLVLTTVAQLAAAGRPKRAARAIELGIAALIVAVGAAVAAIGCGAVALWNYALPHLGDIGTPLVVALALLLVGGAALLVARQVWARRAAGPSPLDQARQIGKEVAQMLPSITEMTAMMKDHAGPLVIAALVAGIVMGSGDGPGRRR